MATSNPLSAIFMLLFLLLACFYLFRLVHLSLWIAHLDAENEVGHAMMALGMVIMLAPSGWLSAAILHWNVVLFATSSLWWTVRLFARKPLLALFLRLPGGLSTVRSDAIHVLMHASMCYMFLLMSNMAFSMTQAATYLTCLLLVLYAGLTLFYGRKIAENLRAMPLDRLQLGDDLAHLLMSGGMCWMFLTMIAMVVTMNV
jgi:hypothetical protein